MVQHKKQLFKTEKSRIKTSLSVQGFQQFHKLPTQFKPSLDTIALQKQRMHILVEASILLPNLITRVDYCLTAFMDICELHWFVQLQQ